MLWLKWLSHSWECFRRIVWRPWAKRFILSVLFALIVEKSSPTLHSIWKTDCPTAKKIGTNCSRQNVYLVGFRLKLVIVGLRLLTTIITANALIARSAKTTLKAKAFLSKLENRFARAMPGCESKLKIAKCTYLWAFLLIFQENKSVKQTKKMCDFLFIIPYKFY